MCVHFSIMATTFSEGESVQLFRNRTQPLDSLDDDQLVSRYRLSRHCIIDLCDLLAADLERSTTRSNALSVSTQVLVALCYFATGSFQRVARDLHDVSLSSVSRCVTGVGKAFSSEARVRSRLIERRFGGQQ